MKTLTLCKDIGSKLLMKIFILYSTLHIDSLKVAYQGALMIQLKKSLGRLVWYAASSRISKIQNELDQYKSKIR